MTKELQDLITQNYGRTLTRDELIIQVRSAAYGDLAIEEPQTTRIGIDNAVDMLILQGEIK